MPKKHPSKKVISDAAKDLRNPRTSKEEKELAASILSSAGNKNK